MDEADVRERLREVRDPDLRDDIVSLGLVNEIDIHDAGGESAPSGDGNGEQRGSIHVDLALGAPYSPNESAIAADVREALDDTGREIELTASIDRGVDPEEQVLPGVKNIIAVASGKGGVGKSTLAVNLAAGLSEMGARVGLFDADVYGPNVPRMVAADEHPKATEDDQIVPPEKFGMKLMSMDFLVGEDDPVIWRGPMVDKVLTQLWEDVVWGSLDYMVIDLPPGTGDTQLTMLQSVPVTGAVIATTPQDVAIDDARKGLEMFARHDTPVLGMVENMSTFTCPDCGNQHDIFDSGGGREFSEETDLPFLGEIPLDPSVRAGGDDGEPMVLDEDSETGDAFREFVHRTAINQGIVHRKRHSDRTKATQ